MCYYNRREKQATSSTSSNALSETGESSVTYQHQKNKISQYVDTMSESDIENAQMKLARAIYASGCPLSLVENKYWLDCMSSIRPAFKMPTRNQMSNSLLDKTYNETVANVKSTVAAAPSVALVVDGWSNIRNEGIMNIMVVPARQSPLFWKSVNTGSESHTGEYIAQMLVSVIEEIGPMKVTGICTDNAANMKKAWEIISQKYPHIFTYGCMAHTLHLVFNDFSKIKSIQQNQLECTRIVKAVKKSQILSALFCEHQKRSDRESTSLKLPSTTRWGSVCQCYDSLIKNKRALQGLAIDDRSRQYLDNSVKSLLLSEIFWDQTEGFHKLLEPFLSAIKLIQGDEVSLSVVMKVFADLDQSIAKNLSQSPTLKSEENSIKKILPSRKSFITKKIHLAANLLDPRFRGEHIDEEDMIDAIETIHEIATHEQENSSDKVLAEVADYRSKEKLFSKEFLWKSAEHTSATSWWNGLCASTQLSKIASKILSLPPTSASVERSFSRHGWIHSEKRNRLTSERAAKLVFVSHNMFLLDDFGSEIISSSQKIAVDTTLMEDDEDDDVDFNENDTSMSVMSDIMLDSGVYIFHKMVLFKPTEYRLVYQMHFLQ